VALFLALFLPFGSMTTFSLPGALVALGAFLIKALLFFLVVAVLENVMARMRFMKTPATTWLALGAAVISFVFYLANI
jgi:hydrogenase-4 component C